MRELSDMCKPECPSCKSDNFSAVEFGVRRLVHSWDDLDRMVTTMSHYSTEWLCGECDRRFSTPDRHDERNKEPRPSIQTDDAAEVIEWMKGVLTA